ncbi:tyrosine-type recombinase/integrase [Nocardiopsis baichengensis]|uniref:tyrosine-type recombinase/integrase n=1 Tax=Nocardiopsis baichengensis TaxID=280240 RepID=UPI00034C3958|nr:site-specific integrase [Nocardiopsis baichengensis]
MIDPNDLGYQVRIWKTEVYEGARVRTYTVRWRVGKKPHRRPHGSSAQAEAFRSQLVQAQSRGEGFSITRGLPVSLLRAEAEKEAEKRAEVTWYDFAVSYVDHKWPDISAKHRGNIAFALTMATTALFTTDQGMPDPALLRTALRRFAFSKTFRAGDRPQDVVDALEWVAAHSRPVADLADSEVARAAVQAAIRDLRGKKLVIGSQRRNHGILRAALAHAVDKGLLDRNPIGPLEVSSSRTVHQVDRRCVVNPEQARSLLDKVREYGYEETEQRQGMKSGPRLVAFFGAMYYAALRPEEAVNLHKRDLSLPPPKREAGEDGSEVVTYDWGTIYVGEVTPDARPEFTDDGTSRDTRQSPKQRAEGEVRPVACPPELTRLLWEHMEQFGTGPMGRLFTGVRGGPLSTITYRRAWSWAREQALSEADVASPLAQRPYDLRHTCVSTWLNAGVSETLVAQWAGHSVAVLKRIYAKCLVGEEDRAKRQIEEAHRRF